MFNKNVGWLSSCLTGGIAMTEKRKDSKKRVLKEGEYQRANGTYEYRWRAANGRRSSVYAKTLEELREKEQDIFRDKCDGIRTESKNVTVNDVYDLWRKLKKGLKDNTFSNYQYMYDQFVYEKLGKQKVVLLKRSDIRRFYNYLADDRLLKASTIDNVHTVLHQVLDLAVEDGYLRANPSDNALKELKQTHNIGSDHRKALTIEEQKRLINFLISSEQYSHWEPIITVMLEAGLRVGEATGLRWDDVDLERGLIDVNHTLIYYNHRVGGPAGCYFGINTPKTEAGRRVVPMTKTVRNAFIREYDYQQAHHISCTAHIDGYTDFVFINRFGNVQHQGTLNKALRRVIRDCNEDAIEAIENGRLKKSDLVLLPSFSCHSLRHTCATRLCESGVNMKVIQDFLGHADISTTMNIYADATREFKSKEISRFDDYLAESFRS